MPQYYNFVKFQRGSENAYGRLRVKDPDTLYFVYKNESDKFGSLYLGDKLISGGNSDTVIIPSSFNNLEDSGILNPTDGQIIIYNANTQKWVNINLSDAISGLLASTVYRPQDYPEYDDMYILESFIYEPKYNDFAILRDKLYFYTSNGWELLSAPATKQDIQNLNQQISNINNKIGEPGSESKQPTGIYALIANIVGGLRYRTVETIYDIDYSDPDVGQYIYLIRQEESSDYYNIYDEYIYVNNRLEKIGTINGDNAYINEFIDTVNKLLYDRYEPVDPEDPDSEWVLVPGLISRIQRLENNVNIIRGQIGNLNDLAMNNGKDEYDYDYVNNLTQAINILNEQIIQNRLVWTDFEEGD